MNPQLTIGQRIPILRIEDQQPYSDAFVVGRFMCAEKDPDFSGYNIIDKTGMDLYFTNANGDHTFTHVATLVVKKLK